MKQERRKRERVPNAHLKVQIRVKRRLFMHEWVDVKVLDYCPTGIGIRTDEAYEIGDKIVMSVLLPMEVGDLKVESLEVLVRYKIKYSSCFNYGGEFVLTPQSKNSEKNQNTLDRIHTMLTRYEQLMDKLQTGPLSGPEQ